MKVKVFIEDRSRAYTEMFLERGYEVTDTLEDADLVCFTGGADVDPNYYGESKHPYTHSNVYRDKKCFEIYNFCLENDVPMCGICRGSQFLCVANGGKLWQHVDNHAIGGTHEAIDMEMLSSIQVTSTHHQMMRPQGVEGEDYQLVLTAQLSSYKQYCDCLGTVINTLTTEPDVEAVYFPKSNSFAFQPHPEFGHAPKECTDYFFEKLNQYLGV